MNGNDNKLYHWFDIGKLSFFHGIAFDKNRDKERIVINLILSIGCKEKKTAAILRKFGINYSPESQTKSVNEETRSAPVFSDTRISSTPPLSTAEKEEQVKINFKKALDNWRKFQKKRGAEHYGGQSVWFKKFDKVLLNSIINDLTAAIQLSKIFYDVYELRAQAWEQKREYAKACEDWESAISLAPKSSSCSIHDANGNRWLYTSRLTDAKKKQKRKGKISGFLIDILWNQDDEGKCVPDKNLF